MAGGLNTLQQSASARLVRFACALQWDDIPPGVQHAARRSLVNFFATALAGCGDPALSAASQVFGRLRPGGDGIVIGRSARSDLLHAASLNAMAANVFDFDDTHMPTIIHPTAPIAPALLALAQAQRVSGQALLTAFVAGVEVACRLGNAVSPWHYRHGWHITSTCGIFGAAAACGRLLGLDDRQMLWALGHAAAQSSCVLETLGTMAKSIGVGNAASNGALSALLAREGFEGPADPLEGTHGFLRVLGQEADAGALSRGLGERWELAHNSFKPYPCGIVLHPVVEACLALYHDDGVRLQDVAQVVLVGHPLLRERTDRPHPASGREAQVSAHHTVGVVLAHGQAGLDAFSDASVRQDPAQALRGRLRFDDAPDYAVESATVRLLLRRGGEVSHHVPHARGSLARPLSDAELDQKLRDLCAWGRSGCDAAPLLVALWRIDEQDDAGSIMALATGTP